MNDLGAQAAQPVDHLADAGLVAGDGVGREDDQIPLADRDPLVVRRGHQGQGGHGLPLGARSRSRRSGGGRCSPICSMSIRLVVGNAQQPHGPGQRHVLGHRTTQRGHDPPVGDGGVGDLLDAVDVAGEAGHDDPLVADGRRTARPAPRRPGARYRCSPPPRRWSSRTGAAGSPGPSASAPMRARSVDRPSTGVRSILKSPECRMTPCGV